jgi:hypothetical protein
MPNNLSKCPAAVRNANAFTDTLTVNIKVGTVQTSPVSVPPIADKDDPFVKSVRGIGPLTPLTGSAPSGTSHLVGWNSTIEFDERKRLRNLTEQIYDLANGSGPDGPVHPQAKSLVKALMADAWDNFNEIKRIYDKWKNRRFRTQFGGQSMRMNLNMSIAIIDGFMDTLSNAEALQLFYAFVGPQANCPSIPPGGRVTLSQRCSDYFDQVKIHADVTGTIDREGLLKILLIEQLDDRARIRTLYRDAYKMLWCAEYGVAQSESYYENLAKWMEGPGKQAQGGGFAPTPTPPPPQPVPAVGLGQFGAVIPTEPPIQPPPPQDPAILLIDPETIDWGAILEPDLGISNDVTPPPNGLPPDEDDVPDEPLQPGEIDAAELPVEPDRVYGEIVSYRTPWYRTTPGKVAIGVGATGLVVGTAWYLLRPRF